MSDDVMKRRDAMDFYVGDDPHDHFPWTFGPYVQQREEDGIVLGGISTPNGRRPDGSMHTYWHVVGDVWEPTAVMICKAVNAEAAARYGTPNPPTGYEDEWRKIRNAAAPQEQQQ